MINVIIYASGRNRGLYFEEFDRRFMGKFPYYHMINGILWEYMRIEIVNDREHVRGHRADIVINFNQYGIDILTAASCINIKEKRTTTYFDLLNSINNDGTFNWEKFLAKEEDDEWLF